MPNNSETVPEVACVEDITKAITQLAKKDEQLTYQAVLECFYEHIINNVSDLDAFEKSKASWIRRINQVATICKVDLAHQQPTWKTVNEVLRKKLSSSPATEPASSSFKSPLSSSKSPSPLKTTLNEKDKVEFERMFATLDKSKFWILKASIEEAKRNDLPIDSIESVEEKVMKFAMSCNFKHPGHSFIVDLDDGNWDEVFSPAELEEMEEFGAPLLPPIDSKVSEKLNELAKLKTAKEAYNFACRLDHDPEEEPLMAWLMMSISQTAYQFLKKNNLHISNYLEADQQYYLWSFISTIFHGTESIWPLGKEKSSNANATANNSKRKLSAVNEICRKAMGRKMDTVYIGGDVELGCMEIGKSAADQTKEIKDGYIKMPLVMKDMLLNIANKAPSLVHNIHITGYSINGTNICMLDVDSPKGYITRVRRTRSLPYPSDRDTYVIRMIPLLRLAATAMAKMQNTLDTYNHAEIPLASSKSRRIVLPPCFHPTSTASTATSKTTTSSSSSTTASPSSSSSSSTTASPSSSSSSLSKGSASKRQKTKQ